MRVCPWRLRDELILCLAIAFVLLLQGLSSLFGWLERRYEIGLVLCLTIAACLWSFLLCVLRGRFRFGCVFGTLTWMRAATCGLAMSGG